MTNKSNNMQRIANIAMAASILVLLASCGGGAKDELGKKKEELEQLKKEQQALNDKVAAKTAEVVKLDPTFADAKGQN
jgi:hypothetical protein